MAHGGSPLRKLGPHVLLLELLDGEFANSIELTLISHRVWSNPSDMDCTALLHDDGGNETVDWLN
jgi:hypothetical protein